MEPLKYENGKPLKYEMGLATLKHHGVGVGVGGGVTAWVSGSPSL